MFVKLSQLSVHAHPDLQKFVLEPGLGAKAKDEHESRRGVLQVGAMSAAQSQRQNLEGKVGITCCRWDPHWW